MRVNSPIMSVDARGGFGPGVVFGKFCGTNVARIRIRTPVRRTAAEVMARNVMAMAAQAWGGLAEIKREAWEAYALTRTRYNSMGESYYATGQNEFMGNYVIRKMTQESIREDPPEDEIPSAMDSITNFQVPGFLGFKIGWSWPGGDEVHVEIMISQQRGWARSYYCNQAVFKVMVKHPQDFFWYIPEMARQSYGIRLRYISAQGQGGPWVGDTVKVVG